MKAACFQAFFGYAYYNSGVLEHSFDNIGMQFRMLTGDEKGCMYPPLLQPIQKLCSVARVGAVVC